MFDLKITGLSEAQKQIQGTIVRSGNLTPIAPSVWAAVQDDVKQRFDSSPNVRATATVFGGVTWRELSDRYIKSAKREGGVQLRITGDLERQFQRGQAGNVAESTANTITFGADSPKAAGLDKRRKLLPIHPELILDVSQILGEYVAAGFIG